MPGGAVVNAVADNRLTSQELLGNVGLAAGPAALVSNEKDVGNERRWPGSVSD